MSDKDVLDLLEKAKVKISKMSIDELVEIIGETKNDGGSSYALLAGSKESQETA